MALKNIQLQAARFPYEQLLAWSTLKIVDGMSIFARSTGKYSMTIIGRIRDSIESK